MSTNTKATAICAAGVLAGVIAAALALRSVCSGSAAVSPERPRPKPAGGPRPGGGNQVEDCHFNCPPGS